MATTTKKTDTKTKPVEKKIETVKEETISPGTKYKSAEKSEIPNDALIPVTSLLEGDLFYSSKITLGFTAEWRGFGEVVEMEFKELKSMVASQKRFFTEPWISIPEDVVKALRIERYYKTVALTPEEFEDLFSKEPSEMTRIISGLSASFKNAVRLRALKLIEEKQIDSIRVKEAIEAGLGKPLED